MSAIWPDLKSPFMEAVKRAEEKHAGRPVFDVINRKHKAVLGLACWYSPWRQFIFRGEPDAVFSADCLDALSAWLKALTKEARGG